MPKIPNQLEPELVFAGYYVRYLPERNGEWKYYIPHVKFEYPEGHPQAGVVWKNEYGNREQAIEFFTASATAPMKVEGRRVAEIVLCHGGQLKRNNTFVDGGQPMRRATPDDKKGVHIASLWDPEKPDGA